MSLDLNHDLIPQPQEKKTFFDLHVPKQVKINDPEF